MREHSGTEPAISSPSRDWFAISAMVAWGSWFLLSAGAVVLLHTFLGWEIPGRDGSAREALTILASIAYLIVGVLLHRKIYSFRAGSDFEDK